ncbi:nucleoside:proton symporter [Sphingorhabdus lutea]|uniref:Nucleoside:proton symporter n=1 Tax=Sphingorhabdus lutea TaxID=1913578 RepID=A0A1L3JAX9_9SPHN|nr:nucleoside transporter C-terminal domain-containing protein [Sphingorhabdus lutea]APG62290.1 nucleoside:proton symporter [Sphingorhabdus lutea]
MNIFTQFQGVIGIALILALAWIISENRFNKPKKMWILGALAIQLCLAFMITRVPVIWDIIALANHAVSAVEKATLVGSSYMFGYIGGGELPFNVKEGQTAPLIIAFQILPLVIVFSALAALFWHWRILPAIVRGLSWALQKTMKVSGVVGLSGGANIFLGVVESPLVVRAYFAKMPRGELFMIMVLAMSTISGAILILYAQTLSKTLDNAVGHMIAASIISLPAAILVARLIVPNNDEEGENNNFHPPEADLKYDNSIDAVIKGTMDGMQLFLAVIAIIIVVFALVALADQILATLPHIDGQPITLRGIFGWIFAPLMWAIGVPWDDAGNAGALMGTKAILNEYVAYLDLAALGKDAFPPRSMLIITYALCGVANLASIGLLVSTIGTLCPERRAEVAALGVKSWIAGNFATMMTGAIVGIITPI